MMIMTVLLLLLLLLLSLTWLHAWALGMWNRRQQQQN
jgi:hypothetical protein